MNLGWWFRSSFAAMFLCWFLQDAGFIATKPASTLLLVQMEAFGVIALISYRKEPAHER